MSGGSVIKTPEGSPTNENRVLSSMINQEEESKTGEFYRMLDLMDGIDNNAKMALYYTYVENYTLKELIDQFKKNDTTVCLYKANGHLLIAYMTNNVVLKKKRKI